MEKRRYRPGYHMEFAKGRKKPVPIEPAKIEAVAEAHDTAISGPVDQFEPVAEASAGPGAALAPAVQPDRLRPTPIMTDPGRTGVAPQDIVERSPVEEVKAAKVMEQRESRAMSNDGSDGGKLAMRVFGIVLSVVGFLVFLFVSWLIGLILLLLGIGLLIGGASGSSQSRGREPRSPAQEWQDVVYLKNGSVIRGMVIEQVPNVSLKIRTADGSVFVYAMDQVEKITKEQR